MLQTVRIPFVIFVILASFVAVGMHIGNRHLDSNIYDHGVSCESLKSRKEISEIFIDNSTVLTEIFETLRTCRNNVVSCSKKQSCLTFSTDPPLINIGYSTLSVKQNPRCSEENNYDFLFAYASGCEYAVFANHLSEGRLLFDVPVRSVNY